MPGHKAVFITTVHCCSYLFFYFSNAQYQIKLIDRGVVLGSTYITADVSQLLLKITTKFPLKGQAKECFYTAFYFL